MYANQSIAGHINHDVSEFSDTFDETAPPVGLDMAGHDMYLLGPKIVMLDSFVVDLLHVDTSAQTFRLKVLVNMDWEDDGTIMAEFKAKRNLGRTTTAQFGNQNSVMSDEQDGRASSSSIAGDNHKSSKDSYKTGKYVLKKDFQDDPLSTTWNPQMVLVNAIADESPIEDGSKLHSVQMLAGRPVISRSVLYQPECRCAFSFSNFPFDETDLVIRFSSNKWNSEQVNFMWTHRLMQGRSSKNGTRASAMFGGLRRESSFLKRTVDESAIGGIGLSEFEIVRVRVESDEKDVNSLQRYDNAQGGFSQAHLIIRVRRDPYSYLLRVASVAELLMFLEVLSFLTDNGDLSARFSISGTIFLAMVSLYGPMADALPKVSVVTRVDKWHLFNFFLLFASNVENLLAFMVRNMINAKVIEYTESLFGIIYLYFVLKNLLWFIKPLQDREEYALLWVWFEDKVELYEEKFTWLVEKVFPWKGRQREEKETRNRSTAKWGMAGKAVKSMLAVKSSVSGAKKTTNGSESPKPKRPSVGFAGTPLHKEE